MATKICDKCNHSFTTRAGNYVRHYNACNGTYKSKSEIGTCKHCKSTFDLTDNPKGWMANHTRWCDKNPKLNEYNSNNGKSVIAMNEARISSGRYNQFSVARLENTTVPIHPCKGNTYSDRKYLHTIETKKLIREVAHRTRFWARGKQNIPYNGVILESSWELKLAISLDTNSIIWNRPKPITWSDGDIIRNYYPDFYLPEFDLYIDPKNKWVELKQIKKLEILNNTYNNIVILRSEKQCVSLTKEVLTIITSMVKNNTWYIFHDIFK